MSTHLPKYLLSTWGDHYTTAFPDLKDLAACDAAAELRHTIGEYHIWTPSETPQPGDLCFVVMRQARHRQPHPNWVHLPHVYKNTTISDHHKKKLKGWAKDSFDKALQQDGSYTFGQLIIQSDHDVVDLALSLHAIHPVFEP